MPACCAKYCKNRTENGFRMFKCPGDKQRRQVWIEKCGKNLTPTSRLCEYHFDDSQFENQRQDKWRKLKPNTVPTIFNNNQNNSTITINNQLAVGQQTPHENLFENDYVRDFNPVISTNFNTNIKNNENVIDENSLVTLPPRVSMLRLVWRRAVASRGVRTSVEDSSPDCPGTAGEIERKTDREM